MLVIFKAQLRLYNMKPFITTQKSEHFLAWIHIILIYWPQSKLDIYSFTYCLCEYCELLYCKDLLCFTFNTLPYIASINSPLLYLLLDDTQLGF
jgi:hypothetical protein